MSTASAFCDRLSSDFERAWKSTDEQMFNLKTITENSSNVIIEIQNNISKSKTQQDQNYVPYNISNEALQNLVRISENFPNFEEASKIISNKSGNGNSSDFENFRYTINQKTDNLTNALQRLEAVKENVVKMRDDLLIALEKADPIHIEESEDEENIENTVLNSNV